MKSLRMALSIESISVVEKKGEMKMNASLRQSPWLCPLTYACVQSYHPGIVAAVNS